MFSFSGYLIVEKQNDGYKKLFIEPLKSFQAKVNRECCRRAGKEDSAKSEPASFNMNAKF